MEKITILAFQGSRSLKGVEVWEIIDAEVKKHNPDYIVTSGETAGVCEITRDYCRKNGIPLKLHFFNRKKYGRGIYHHRSMAIMTECTFCVFIHDGFSKGTKNEMVIAKKLKRENTYHRLSADLSKEINLSPD